MSSWKLRYAYAIVGLFMVLVMAILLVGFLWLKRSSAGVHFTIAGQIRAEDLDGLEVGSDVVLLGQPVGKIVGMRPNVDLTQVFLIMELLEEDDETELHVREQILTRTNDDDAGIMGVADTMAIPHVRSNVEFRIQHKVGGVGAAFLEVVLLPAGQRRRTVPNAVAVTPFGHGLSGRVLPVAPVAATATMQTRVADNADSITTDFRRIKNEIIQFQSDMHETQSETRQTLAETQASLTHLREQVTSMAESLALMRSDTQQFQQNWAFHLDKFTSDWRVIRDNTGQVRQAIVGTMDRSQETMQNVDATAREAELAFQQIQKSTESIDRSAQQIANDLSQSSRKLNGVLDGTRVVVDALRREARDLPGTVRKTQATLDGAQEVIEGMRGNFLVKPYLYSPATSRTVTPAEVGR